jgi:hypothetical protein
MSRMILILFIAIWSTGDARAGDGASSVRFAVEVRFIQIELSTLGELGRTNPSERVCRLSDIEAFFLRHVVAENDTDKSVVARSKSTFPEGKPMVVSNHFGGAIEAKEVRRKGAWADRRPLELRLLAKAESKNSLSMTVSYPLDENEKSLGPWSVADGNTVLLLLEEQDGSWGAALITPWIIPPE